MTLMLILFLKNNYKALDQTAPPLNQYNLNIDSINFMNLHEIKRCLNKKQQLIMQYYYLQSGFFLCFFYFFKYHSLFYVCILNITLRVLGSVTCL